MRNERVVVELIDDLDGTGNANTVTFGLDGRRYEIELNKKNETALRKALAPFIDKAREAPAAPLSKRGARRPRGTGVDNKAVRQWAAENGVEVPPTGRIRREIIEQYEAAQGA